MRLDRQFTGNGASDTNQASAPLVLRQDDGQDADHDPLQRRDTRRQRCHLRFENIKNSENKDEGGRGAGSALTMCQGKNVLAEQSHGMAL